MSTPACQQPTMVARFCAAGQASRGIRAMVGFALAWLLLAAPLAAGESFEIQVVDSETGRGVPLVELKTTHHVLYVTDSAGRVAFDEADLMNREVYFDVRSHGYEVAKDGFGFAGVRLTPKPGGRVEVKLKRINIAERLYRITGAGIYRDTKLLGHQAPDTGADIGLVGQDSALLAIYQHRLYWFFGDTTLARYPLGVFRMTGATSPSPLQEKVNLDGGVKLTYFTTDEGHPRAMIPLADEPQSKEGVVWIDGITVVKDKEGRARMVGRFQRLRGLGEPLEQGVCVWNDEKERFDRVTTQPLTEERLLKSHPVLVRDEGVDYLYCGVSIPTLRVRATYEDVLDPKRYEAWTCLGGDGKVQRDGEGKPQFAWKKNAEPWTPKLEARHLRESEYQIHPRDVATGKPISLHAGSVRWNKHRQKWITIIGQEGGSSYLGEIWYSEADAPTGPWQRAVKILTHDKYSFYNPVHHDFFDDGGTIYFQGTYVHTFSGNTDPTPRYDYNQIMYRLNLDDPRLTKVRP